MKLVSLAVLVALAPVHAWAQSSTLFYKYGQLSADQLNTLDRAKVNIQRGQMSAPAVQDWINAPYLAVPEFYITAAEKSAGNWGPALQKAMADVAAHGGGTVRLLPHAYHVVAQTPSVPAGVTIEGAAHVTGVVPNNDYRTLPYSLLIDPGYTIALTYNTSLRRLVVASSRLGLPKNNADMVAELQRWAGNGTAITATGTSEDAGNAPSDIELSDLFIIGFNQAIQMTYAERVRIDGVSGDNISGLSLDYCLDICRISNVHWNSFINYHTYIGGEWVPVASITNNGSGALRITVPTGYAYDLQTGWTVTAFQGDGQNNPGNIGGKFTVKRISDTQFDLIGSTYVSDASGGDATGSLAKVYLDNSARSGVAFSFTHAAGLNLTNNFAFGYQVGFRFGDEAQWPFCVDNSVDAYLPARDPDRVGVLVTGSAGRMQWSGGYISSTHDPFKFVGSDTYPHTITGVNIGATYNSAIDIESGRVLAMGNTLAGGAPILIGAGSNGLSTFVGAMEGSQIKNQSAYTPLVIDTTTATLSGLTVRPARVSKLTALPLCNASNAGVGIYVDDLRKPGEAAGSGTGGNAICAGASGGSYNWVSQFSGTGAVE